MHSLRHNFGKTAILITIVLILPFCAYWSMKIFVFNTPAKYREPYQTVKNYSDTIRIGYIGDSWASLHLNHQCIIPEIININVNRPVKVESFGLSGFTSKEIYNHFFDNVIFKTFLEKGFDYCVISAGINDSNQKRSPFYYTNSMNCIIQFMLSNHIHPIIIELPDYDINKAYQKQKKHKKVLRDIYMYLTGYPKDCKDVFRTSLNNLINKKGYNNKVSIIRYKSWNDNYSEDLSTLYQEDGIHLNDDGYEKLDYQIAQTIYQLITANK